MPFWSEISIEPKRKFRWLLYFSGLPQFVVKSVSKPKFNIGSQTHDFLNYKFNYPGKVEWQSLSMTLVDPVQPDAVKSFMQILENSGYQMPDDFVTAATGQSALGGIKSITKQSMVTSLGGEIQIVQLASRARPETDGPAGIMRPVEKWTVHNPIITSVDFDDLDYGNEEIMNIKIEMKYDWANLDRSPAGGGWNTFNLESPNSNINDFTGE